MTDTSKMRSEFESFCREVQGWEDDDFRLASDGVNYYWGTTGEAWIFWQASRQAVVVELPEPEPFDVDCDESLEMEPEEYEALEAAHGARWSEHSRLKKAIEAQGLRCEVKA